MRSPFVLVLSRAVHCHVVCSPIMIHQWSAWAHKTAIGASHFLRVCKRSLPFLNLRATEWGDIEEVRRRIGSRDHSRVARRSIVVCKRAMGLSAITRIYTNRVLVDTWVCESWIHYPKRLNSFELKTKKKRSCEKLMLCLFPADFVIHRYNYSGIFVRSFVSIW